MKTRLLLGVLLLFGGANLAMALAGGANFDFLKDEDRAVLEKRFVKDIYPLMLRGDKQGCVACHNGKIVSSLKMSGNAEKDFRMLVKEGFFIPNDSGSALTRITTKNRKQKMPPPGKGEPWTEKETQLLHDFVMDLDKKQQKKLK